MSIKSIRVIITTLAMAVIVSLCVPALLDSAFGDLSRDGTPIITKYVEKNTAYAAVTKLKAPTAVKLDSVSKAKQITITWKKSKTSGASYAIYMASQAAPGVKVGKYKKIKSVKAGAKTAYTKKKLEPGVKYYFKVYAVSGKSKKAAKAKADYARKAGPVIMKLVPMSRESYMGVRATWTAVASPAGKETSYKFEYRLAGKKWSDYSDMEVSTTTQGYLGGAGKTYVRVNALSPTGKSGVVIRSAWSAIKTYTVPSKPTNATKANYYFSAYAQYELLPNGGYHGGYTKIFEGDVFSYIYDPYGIFDHSTTQISTPSARIQVTDPAATVMFTVKTGDKPSLTHGIKVTKSMGEVFALLDKNNAEFRMIIYKGGRQVAASTYINGTLLHYQEIIAHMDADLRKSIEELMKRPDYATNKALQDAVARSLWVMEDRERARIGPYAGSLHNGSLPLRYPMNNGQTDNIKGI